MTSSKHTKRVLLASVLSFALCAAMLVGTTFAWFTDSVTSGNNIIKSGALEVAMDWADGKTDPAANEDGQWQDVSHSAIFDYALWEPGYTQARHIRIRNTGNLALKYEIRIAPTGTVTDLAKVIDVYYIKDGRQIADRTDLEELEPVGTLDKVLADPVVAKGHLLAEAGQDVDTATIVLKMQEGAGSEYENMSIGDSFTIQLVATQFTHEDDSFGNDYDAGAEYPVVVSTSDGLKDALLQGGEIVLADDVEVMDGTQLYVKEDSAIDFNGNTFKGSLYNGDFTASAPDVNLVLSDPNNTGDYSIDSELVRLEGGGMRQTASIAVWHSMVTIESGKYRHNNAVINCQLQTGNPDAVGVIINGGTFEGKDNASVVSNVIGRVVINDGTFIASKGDTGAGECIYLSAGSSRVPTITTINGGDFKAEARIFYINPKKGYEQKIEVNGGNYTVAEGGKLVEVKDGASAKDILVITGGTFNVDPSEYVDIEHYNVTNNNGTWSVTAK